MLASLDEPPVAQAGLVYEPKYDGIRALVDLRPGRGKASPPKVAVYSRNGNDKTAQFPEVVRALQSVATRVTVPLLLDGEIVAVDPSGRPLGFQHIQGRIHLTSPADIERAAREQPTALILFDMLRDGDEDLRGVPLAARRLRLQERVRPHGARTGGRATERDCDRRRPADAPARARRRLGGTHREGRRSRSTIAAAARPHGAR